MILEVKYTEKETVKKKNTNFFFVRLNNMLLNNQWITKEIKEEIKKNS